MRVHLKLEKNKEIIPFNYQPHLVGCLHKWLGHNAQHDAISLYSFSWLKNGEKKGDGLNFSQGSSWHISMYDQEMLKKVIRGIQQSPDLFGGMRVNEITIQETPIFGNVERFMVASPVFIKRKDGENTKFYFHGDAKSSEFLTETLKNKLLKAGLLETGVEVTFDNTYSNPVIKAINYRGIINKASLCPVIIKGTAEQIGFAWNVGVGNSTGIGFGALN